MIFRIFRKCSRGCQIFLTCQAFKALQAILDSYECIIYHHNAYLLVYLKQDGTNEVIIFFSFIRRKFRIFSVDVGGMHIYWIFMKFFDELTSDDNYAPTDLTIYCLLYTSPSPRD